MTIKLLTDWPYRRTSGDGLVTIPAGSIVSVFDSVTEAGMITAKIAATSSEAVSWVAPNELKTYAENAAKELAEPGAVATVVLMGDSRIAAATTVGSGEARYDYQGWFIALNQMLGAQFDIRGAFGTDGVFSSTVLSLQLPLALAISPLPEYAVIDVGYNDAQTGIPYATTASNVSAVVSALADAGVRVILTTSKPGSTVIGTSTLDANLKAYNNWVMKSGSMLDGVVRVLDLASQVVDPATGGIPTALSPDGIHVNCAGSATEATGVSSHLSDLAASLPSPLLGVIDANVQLIGNPRLIGSSATGIGTGTSGTLPTGYVSARSGTATGVFSQVARPDLKQGNRTKIEHTGGSRGNYTQLQYDNFRLYDYSASTFYNFPDRVRPTVANGKQYLAINTGGATPAGADPTASWSTVLGTVFTVGTVQFRVVESIDIGDTVQLVAEVWADTFSGGANIRIGCQVLTSGYASLITSSGGYADNSTSAYASPVAPYQIIRSHPFAIPATAQILSCYAQCISEASVTGNWYVGAMELQKYTT